MRNAFMAMVGTAAIVMVLAGCAWDQGGLGSGPPMAAARAEAVSPLRQGARAPAIMLRDPDGRQVDLAELYARKPSVLIFYRGGWCPYCNAQLSQIASVEAELLSMGYQVLAVSPDRPAELARTLGKQKLGYRLLSDSDMTLALSFGLAFRVDADTRRKYERYNIDLERASGRNHHLLPVPAVFIIDTQRVIRFAYWDADYKIRLSSGALLRAARENR